MKIELVVIEAFLGHVKGEIIKDAKLIKEYIESEWQAHFVKKEASADPAPK